MVSLYLGPVPGTVNLTSWNDIVEAADGGMLRETQWVELKEMATPPGKGKRDANVEMARDLASLSVHGGVLIYGVRDSDCHVVGCDVNGLATRISQVASSTVHPPLSPVIMPAIPCPDDDSRAVLIVNVPPSPVAPHMVDGRYWGRSSDGKRVLSDPDVRLLLTRCELTTASFEDRLTAMRYTDPFADVIEDGPTGQGHAYLLAVPMMPMPTAVTSDSMRKMLTEVPPLRADWPGTLRDCHYTVPEPDGYAWASAARGVRTTFDYEQHLVQVTVKDADGSIEVMSGGASAIWETAPSVTRMFVLAPGVTILAVQMVTLAERLSAATGYVGQWRVGVHLTGLKNATRPDAASHYNPLRYPASTYTRSHVASVSDMADASAVATRMLSGLYRGLGCDGWSADDIIREQR